MAVAEFAPWSILPASHIDAFPYCQKVDLCQVRDPATGVKRASISASYNGLEYFPGPTAVKYQSYPIDNLLVWNGGDTRWVVGAGQSDVTSSLTLTIDLGATYSLALVAFYMINNPPRKYQIDTSVNGTDWDAACPEADWVRQNSDVLEQRGFPPRSGRYVRIKLIGIPSGNTSSQLRCSNIIIPASVFQVPAITVADGIHPTYQAADYSAGHALAITSGWVASRNHYKPWSGYGWRGGTATATTDDSFVIDLNGVKKLIGLECNLSKFSGDWNLDWKFGARIEWANDYVSGPWTTLYDTSSPFTETYLDWHASPVTCGYLRITNKYGTYGPGDYNRYVYDPIDLNGLSGTGVAAFTFMPVLGDTTATAPKKVVTVHAGPARWLSVSACSAAGQVLREILTATPVIPGTSYDLCWNGRDQIDGALSSGDVLIRAAGSQMTCVEKTIVGASGPLGAQPYNTDLGHAGQGNSSQFHGYCNASCVRPDGKIITSSPGEETTNITVMHADGTFERAIRRVEVHAVAGDATNLWLGFINTSSPSTSSPLHITKFTYPIINGGSNDPGVVAPYSISETFNASYKLRDPINTRRASRGVNGLAVDHGGTRLWATIYSQDRILCLDKTAMTLVQATALSINNPVGIAMDPRRTHVWVSYDDDKVSAFPINGDGTLGTATATISGLNDPDGVACADLDPGGTHDYRLVFIEMDGANIDVAPRTTKVREYDINTIASPVNDGTFADFGTAYTPPTVSDTAWHEPSGISMDNDGNLILGDRLVKRTLRFRYSDGACYQRGCRQFGPAAWVDEADHTATTFRINVGGQVHEVNPDTVTWTPEQGGLIDGKSRLVESWSPIDRFGGSQGGYVGHRTFWHNGRRYLIEFDTFGTSSGSPITVYAFEPGGIRRVAVLSRYNRGLDLLSTSTNVSWEAVDDDGSGGLFASGERTLHSGESLAPGLCKPSFGIDGRIWLPLLTPSLLPGGTPDTGGKKVYSIPPQWDDLGGGIENAAYHGANLEGLTTQNNWVSPWTGNTYWQARQVAELGDGGAVVEYELSGETLTLARHDAAGTRLWTVPSERGYPDYASQYLYRDPLDRCVHESGSGGPRNWIHPRELTYGMVIGRIGGDFSKWGNSWCDFYFGCCAFRFHDRDFAALEANAEGHVHIYEYDGLESYQIQSDTIAWSGLDSWDDADAVEFTMVGSVASGLKVHNVLRSNAFTNGG